MQRKGRFRFGPPLRVGISNVNLSNLKTGKVKAVRFSTLDAICGVLDCQPGDILEYQRDAQEKEE